MTIDFEKKIAELINMPQGKPLSEQEQNTLYASAYSLYQEGNYETAAQLFTQLILVNPFNHGFWLGLASSEQMRKEYTAALHAWAMVALLNNEDPFAHFHAGECYLSLNDPAEALKAFTAAEARLKAESEAEQKLAEKIQVLKRTHCQSHAPN